MCNNQFVNSVLEYLNTWILEYFHWIYNFCKFLYFGIVEDNKIAKNKVGPIVWDTLYYFSLLSGTSGPTKTTATTTAPETTTTSYELPLGCPQYDMIFGKPRKAFRWQGKVKGWKECAMRCRKIEDCQYWQYWGEQEQTCMWCITMFRIKLQYSNMLLL